MGVGGQGERRSPSPAHSMDRHKQQFTISGEGEVLALCWHGAHGPVCNPDETHPVVKNKRHGRGRETSWKENWEEWGGYKRGQ